MFQYLHRWCTVQGMEQAGLVKRHLRKCLGLQWSLKFVKLVRCSSRYQRTVFVDPDRKEQTSLSSLTLVDVPANSLSYQSIYGAIPCPSQTATYSQKTSFWYLGRPSIAQNVMSLRHHQVAEVSDAFERGLLVENAKEPEAEGNLEAARKGRS